MENYFYDMIPSDELEQLPYIPTIPELLQKMSVDYAERIAVNHLNTAYSYSELCQRVGRRRMFLRKKFLPLGSKIAVFDRNTLDAIEWFLAITSAGFVVLMLPLQTSASSLPGTIKKFDISAVIAAKDFVSQVKDSGVEVPVFESDSIENYFSSSSSMITKDTLAAIFFTGGTTGVPKGAMLTHGNLMRGSFNGIFMPGSVLQQHRYVTFLPFAHVFGTIRGMLSCLYTGAELFTCEDIKFGISRLSQIKPTCLVLVPGLAEILVNLVKMQGDEFLGGELKTIVCGGANCPPSLILEFVFLGINLLQGYGLTETSNLVAGNRESMSNPFSVGKIYPETLTKIVSSELWIKGDSVFKGYYGDDKLTLEAFEDGWFKTGDLVTIDSDGYLYIIGRIKNLIILKNGENISPESIEELFYKSPLVKDCLVKEVDAQGEKVIGIEILPEKSAFLNKNFADIYSEIHKLVDQVNSSLPTYMRVLNVLVRTEDFKRSASLKIIRNQ